MPLIGRIMLHQSHNAVVMNGAFKTLLVYISEIMHALSGTKLNHTQMFWAACTMASQAALCASAD